MFTDIYSNSLFESGIGQGGNGAYKFYLDNEDWLYTLPLILGVIFIAKKFYFPKVTLTKLVDKNLSNADELKKYSDLKDQGIITEEEFQTKKKKLLDL